MGLSSSSRANFSIDSGSFGNVEFLQPRVDNVERAVIFGLGTALAKKTQYTLHVQQGGGANALVAFDGTPFVGSLDIPFTTADDDDESLEASDVPPPDPCHVYLDTFAGCLGDYCHGDGNSAENGATAPAMGLSLLFPGVSSDPRVPYVDPIQLTAVGHPSLEAEDPSAVGGTSSVQPRNFPNGMAIVAPHASAASYLLYKILARTPDPAQSSAGSAYIDPTVPDLPDPGGATAADVSAKIFGQPMPDPQRHPNPGSNEPVQDSLTWGERAEIRAWIDDGAPACPCKKPVQVTDTTYECPPADGGVDAADAADATGDAGDAEAGEVGADTAADAGSDAPPSD